MQQQQLQQQLQQQQQQQQLQQEQLHTEHVQHDSANHPVDVQVPQELLPEDGPHARADSFSEITMEAGDTA